MKATSIHALWLAIVLAGALCTIPAMAQADDGNIVWSQSDADRYVLKMSLKQNNQWSAPEQIEESDNLLVVPTLSVDKGGDIHAAWTERNEDQGRIRYKIKRNGSWGPSQELMTDTASDMAPASTIDASGILWLVWSGTNETGDDIYFSRWIDDHWQTPERVNEKDEWPDILPSIAVDAQNQITVSWLGYNGDRYVEYSSYWTGKNWSPEEVVETISLKTAATSQDASDQDLPDFIPEGSRGSLRLGESKPIRKFVKSTHIRSTHIRSKINGE